MADISTGRQRGIVPFVDETTGRLPDQYLPQGVIDLQGDLEQAVSDASQSATEAKASETAAKASETAAARSAQTATEQVSSIGDSVDRAAASATDAQQSASQAQSNATAANSSAQAAAASAESAQTATESAASSKDAAARSASAASESAQAAETSKTNAAASASAAETSKTNAAASASAAETSKTNAAASASAAETSKTNAAASASAAKVSETNAAASATAAQQAVVGLQTTVKEQGSKIDQNTNNISQVSQKADSLEQNINSFKATVSETYTTKDEFNALEIGGTNLFVIGTSKDGFRVSSEGSALPDSGYAISDYIAVQPNEKYILTAYVDGSGNTQDDMVSIARYRSDKSWIDRPIMDTNSFKYGDSWAITATSETAYVRLSFPTSGKGKFKFERGTKPTDWSPAPEDFDGKYASKTELNNYVPLSTYQALEARVQALEAKLSNQ